MSHNLHDIIRDHVPNLEDFSQQDLQSFEQQAWDYVRSRLQNQLYEILEEWVSDHEREASEPVPEYVQGVRAGLGIAASRVGDL